jgi:hypothetical protein
MQEECDAATSITGDEPAMNTDMVWQVEPYFGRTELGLKAPEAFRVLGWKIDGTSGNKLQGKSSDDDDKRPGDVPGDAPRRSL